MALPAMSINSFASRSARNIPIPSLHTSAPAIASFKPITLATHTKHTTSHCLLRGPIMNPYSHYGHLEEGEDELGRAVSASKRRAGGPAPSEPQTPIRRQLSDNQKNALKANFAGRIKALKGRSGSSSPSTSNGMFSGGGGMSNGFGQPQQQQQQSPSFSFPGAPQQQNGFGGFGASGGSGAFGAPQPTPQASQSFPPFTAGSQSGGFNFSSDSSQGFSNPFASSNNAGQGSEANGSKPLFSGSLFNINAPGTPNGATSAPPTTFAFGQSATGASTPTAPASPFNFGTQNKQEQTPQPSTNGFSFGQQTNNNAQTSQAPQSPFQAAQSPAPAFSFGQNNSTQAPASPSPFGTSTTQPSSGFGASTQTQATPNPFGQSTQGQATPNPFGQSTQGQQQTNLFAQPTPSQDKPNLFAQPAQSQEKPNLFAQSTSSQEKPSLFSQSTQGQQQASTSAPSLFSTSATQQQSSAPATSTPATAPSQGGSVFGSPAPQKADAPTFSFGTPAPASDSVSLFSGLSSQKPSASPFNFGTPQQSTSASAPSLFASSASQQQTSTPAPAANPFANLTKPAQATPAAEEQKKDSASLSSRIESPAKKDVEQQSQAPQTNGKRKSPEPDTAAAPSPKPTTNGIFSGLSQNNTASPPTNIFGAASSQTTPASSGGLFSPQKTATSSEPSSGFGFMDNTSANKEPSASADVQSPNKPTFTPPTSFAPSASQNIFSAAKPASPAAQSETPAMPAVSVTAFSKTGAAKSVQVTKGQSTAVMLRNLNLSFRHFVEGADISNDWFDAVQYYVQERQKILGIQSAGGQQDTNTAQATASAQASSQQQNNTSPSKKRKQDETPEREDLTEKRSKGTDDVSYPSLSASSPAKPLSDTASIFDQILNSPSQKENGQEKAATAKPTFTPLTPQPPTNKSDAPAFGSQTAPPKSNPFANLAGVKTDAEKAAAAPQKPTFGSTTATTSSPFTIKPTASNATTSSSPFTIKPSTSSSAPTFGASASKPASGEALSASKPPTFGMPKFGGGGAMDFTKAFGAAASKNEEKEKAKRKAEDFDSDEDDAEEWERQDAERQRAKKQRLEEEAKGRKVKFVPGKGFVTTDEPASPSPEPSSKPAPAATNSNSVFGQPASQSAVNNPFAHLSAASSQAASNEPSDDEDENDAVEEAERTADQQKALPEPAESDADEDFNAALTKASGTPSKGLGDRMTVGADGKPERETPAENTPFKPSTSLFSGVSDNTWKQGSPLKFGSTTPAASPAKFDFGGAFGSTTPAGSPAKPAGASQSTETPKFSFGSTFGSPAADKQAGATTDSTGAQARPFAGLFGGAAAKTASAAPSTTSLFAPKPAGQTVGFNFGAKVGDASSTTGNSLAPSADASRATTPGMTTDAEGSAAESAAGEPDEAQNEPQRDLTALTPEELRTEDVAFERRGKALFYDKNSQPQWAPKGLGPVRLLINKETKKPRVILRQDPSGRVVVNKGLVKNKDFYTVVGAKNNSVKAVFPENDGTLGQWMIMLKTEEMAKELVEKLHAEIEKL